MIWIVAYALAGLAVAVVALSQMAPFDGHGDRACGGAVGLIAALVWPVLVAGWLLAWWAECVGDLVDGWRHPPLHSSYHMDHTRWRPERGYTSSTRPPIGLPPTDGPTSEEPRR